MEIKNLELTDRDFQLLIDGLDELPNRGQAGEMMVDLFAGIMSKDADQNQISEYERKRNVERLKREREKESLKEDIKILQGKLLMFKRFLIQEGALKQANEILNALP